MKTLQGQTALVTGGTAGIGAAIAKRFAEHGAYVVIWGTNRERGEKIAAELSSIPDSAGAAFHQVNVAQFSEVEGAIKQLLETRGNVDILVNNAGITRDQLLMKMSEQDWDDVMDINVKSCYNTTRVLARYFLKARKGKVINISSVVGLVGNPGQTNYAASKAAIIGFTKALAKEVASRNIQVNCIAPGFIDTGMTQVLTEEQKKATLQGIPMGRLGTTDEIADAALFLAGPSSSYITGQVLAVDGGMVM